jgi:ssDNA-binding Zn-finger/Zn-ribbon topoisomerase 1
MSDSTNNNLLKPALDALADLVTKSQGRVRDVALKALKRLGNLATAVPDDGIEVKEYADTGNPKSGEYKHAAKLRKCPNCGRVVRGNGYFAHRKVCGTVLDMVNESAVNPDAKEATSEQ